MFYEQTLGLRFTLERHGDGPKHYQSVVDGVIFELYPLGVGRAPTASVRIGFSVDSIDELILRTQAAGGVIVSEPHDSEWGRRAVIRDLDGHTIELVSPPRPDA